MYPANWIDVRFFSFFLLNFVNKEQIIIKHFSVTVLGLLFRMIIRVRFWGHII